MSLAIGEKRCSKNQFLVDHCHETGNFRGWICRNCNQGIGKLGDDVEGLVKALNYLLKFKKRTDENKQ